MQQDGALCARGEHVHCLYANIKNKEGNFFFFLMITGENVLIFKA